MRNTSTAARHIPSDTWIDCISSRDGAPRWVNDQAWARKYSVITSRAVAQCSVISTASYREITLGRSREVRGTASVFIGDVAICMAIASYVAAHNLGVCRLN